MRKLLLIAVALCLCQGCAPEPSPIQVTLIKVSPGQDKSHFYVHRDAHSLIELSDGTRAIVPGDLGEPGDMFRLRKIDACVIYL